jgi:hypothetical protein
LIFTLLNFSCKHTPEIETRSKPAPSQKKYAQLPVLALLPIFSALSDEKRQEFYHLLYFQLENSQSFRLLSRRETLENFNSSANDPEIWSPETFCSRAKTLDISFFMTAKLIRFEERQGERYGVQKPASIDFQLNLLENQSCSVLWSQRHQETQKALTENLFEIKNFISRGPRWLTVRELARESTQKMIQDMLSKINPDHSS